MLRREFWTSRSVPFLAPDGESGGSAGAAASSDSTAASTAATTDTSAVPTAATADSDAALGDAGKAALQKERERAETAEKELKKLQKAQAARDEAEAKAKGDFEALAKTAQEERDALKAQLAKRDHDDLKRTVATRHKLSSELAARLVGETEAELDADAKALAKLVGAREAPDTEAGAGARGASSPSDRPIPKKPAEGQKTPAYTFDGRPKVAWPNRS